MIVIKILDEKDWERKWIKKISIVTGWVCLKMAWLAENDDILLRAVSEGQKDYMFRVFRKQEYILFWSRKMKKLIYINYVGGAMILMSLSFAVLLYEVEYKKLESKFNKNQFCGIINSSFYAKKKGNIWE